MAKTALDNYYNKLVENLNESKKRSSWYDLDLNIDDLDSSIDDFEDEWNGPYIKTEPSISAHNLKLSSERTSISPNYNDIITYDDKKKSNILKNRFPDKWFNNYLKTANITPEEKAFIENNKIYQWKIMDDFEKYLNPKMIDKLDTTEIDKAIKFEYAKYLELQNR